MISNKDSLVREIEILIKREKDVDDWKDESLSHSLTLWFVDQMDSIDSVRRNLLIRISIFGFPLEPL